MQLLLGSHEECRTSALRACLLASNVSSEGAQSIIKLVATNLIANECITGDENFLLKYIVEVLKLFIFIIAMLLIC